jgi:hypothetical protein
VAQQVLWEHLTAVGFEHLHLAQTRSRIRADGLIIRLEKRTPFRAWYQVQCDAQWRAREVRLDIIAARRAHLQLRSDGAGHWTTASGDSLAVFEGAVDLDISATPFTNTLAIRRLGLRAGEAAEIRAAYVELPKLQLHALPQRYTRLSDGPRGARYRYESVRTGFRRDLQVDATGLCVDYPGIFRRIWPPQAPWDL